MILKLLYIWKYDIEFTTIIKNDIYTWRMEMKMIQVNFNEKSYVTKFYVQIF